MPLLRDKVIINNGGDSGNNAMIGGLNKSIKHRLKTLLGLSTEAEEYGLLKDTVDLRDKMAGYCKGYNDAQQKFAIAQQVYIAALDECIAETAEMIDKYVLSQP